MKKCYTIQASIIHREVCLFFIIFNS